MARQVLTAQAEDFPAWYQDVIAKAELAENGPVRGTMVIRPSGYAIWERMQADMDRRIKAAGAQNAYFPLFIPESYLAREAEHVEGFSPELAVVTHAGGQPLEQPVVVRPTSETIIGESMSRWVQSYRDLPLLLNQWANVVRWELRPRLFLRTTEFLWQEGHTAHRTREDAAAYARMIQRDVYAAFMHDLLAIPVVQGLKTPRERFAGAVDTLALEAMMRDGKALQMGTSHEMGTNFAQAFGIRYLSHEGREELAWTTSWGSSTRMLGGLIMSHGDDRGLRLPPAVAPTQTVVSLVKDGDGVGEAAARLVAELTDRGVRVDLDDRVETPFGRRAVDHELKGVPTRVEMGPRDLAEQQAVVVRRLEADPAQAKQTLPLAAVADAVDAALDEGQQALFDEARRRMADATVAVTSLDEAREAARTGWATMAWRDLGESGETALAADGITVRCLTRADHTTPSGPDEDGVLAVLARAY